MGFRPQPIVRAIGLRWPAKARKIVSGLIKDAITKTGHNNYLTESSLACAIAAVNDRLDEECQSVTKARFEIYMQKERRDTIEIWSKGRVLACIGRELKPETRLKALQDILQTSREKVRGSERSELGAIASAITAAAWWEKSPAEHAESSSHNLKVFNMVIEETIKRLKENPNELWATYKARPLVSLIGALPAGNQRDALEKLLVAVNEWPAAANPNPDILLILAQAFEIVAQQHISADTVDELKTLIKRAEELLRKSGADQGQRHINRIAIARLTIPLTEAAEAHVTTEFIKTLSRVAGVEETFTGETVYFLKPPDELTEEDGLLIGLRGRILAFSIAKHLSQASFDPGKTLESAINAMKLIGRNDNNGPNPAGNFAREGLAHAFAALAQMNGLEKSQQSEALQWAKDALARTGSAEEAAAWATAITNLLTGKGDVEFVEEIVEILKYPTAGLTAREPNAAEPRNATDIFIEALTKRLDLPPQDEISPGYHRLVLEKILEQRKFAQINLETRPRDPRKPEFDI